jgi:glycosyltransferase involved in cell wall biosynthesis/Flp pilus assembly protein TadD
MLNPQKYYETNQQSGLQSHKNMQQPPSPSVHSATKIVDAIPAQSWPKITVVTPSYNHSRYLETCIRSVLEQNYPNVEYIILDGGSTDGSREIIEKYAEHLAFWQSRPDQGQYWAIQEGIARGSGDIITWLNSDDQLHPHALINAASIFMHRKEVAWITGRPCVTNEDGSEIFVLPHLPIWSRQRYLQKRYRDPFIQQEGTFWRRVLWENAGAKLEPGFKLAGDLELWTRFFRHAHLYSVDAPLGLFRVQVSNRSQVLKDLYIKEAEQIIDREIARVEREENPRLLQPPRPITRQEIERYVDEALSHRAGAQPRPTVDEPKRQPLISAIVSAYKSEKYIRGCLEDLLAQTIADRLEIIVIDSASPENEGRIVRECQQQHGNVKYIRTPERETIYAAWNRGIKLAQGKYITTANTDDRHRKDAFEQMAAVLDTEPGVALVYADVIKTATANETFAYCTPTGMLSWCDWDRRVLLEKGCFIGPQPMWRRQVHDTFGYFDESMTVTGDYEFWLRISQIHKFKHIARPLGLYLERGDSVEHANAECKRQEERTIKARYRRAAQRGEMIGIKSRTDLREQHKAPSENKDGPGAQEYQSKDAALNAAPTKGDRIMKLADQVYAVIRTLPENQREIARWMLGKLLIDFPDHAAAQHECAILAHDEGDTAAARMHFQRAAELAPGNADMQKSLADFLHVVQKDLDTAVAQYRKVLTLRPRDLETCLIIAHLNVSRRCFDEAREDYRKVLALDPNHGEARTCLGKLDALKARRISPAELHAKARLACEEGDKPSAIRLLSQLITQNHGDAVAHNDLGVLYFETGRKDLAQFHYETAAELAPENALFQKNLGDFYYVEQGQIEKALRKYVQALTLNPEDVETLLITGQLCLSIDRPEDARVFLNRVLEIEPWNGQAGTLLDQLSHTGRAPARSSAEDLYSRSQSLSASGDSAGAADCLRRLIAEYPDHAAAYNDLGVMHYELGEKNKALQYYEQAVRLNDKNPTFLKNLADFYYVEQGRAQDALNIYVQLMESNHEDVDCLIAAGSICAGLDKESDARIFFERVLQIDPWHTQASDALRQMDLNAAAVDRAAAAFEFPRSAAAGRIV